MKFLAITHKGLEDVCKQEVQELTSASASADNEFVFFETTEERAVLFAEHAQSISSFIALIDQFTVHSSLEKTTAEIRKIVHSLNLDDWLTDNMAFKVVCSRSGTHNFNSPDLSREVSVLLKGRIKSKIHLKHPDIILSLVISDNKGAIGIDLLGLNAAKRDHRVVLHATEVTSLLSYAILRAAQKSKNDVYLDPLCGTGQVTIEAALWMNGISPHEHHDLMYRKLKPFLSITKPTKLKKGTGKILAMDASMPNLRAAEKNARVAGVKKLIGYSRTSLADLDLRCDPNSIDAITTTIFGPNRRIPADIVQQRCKKLLEQAKIILKKKGVVSVLIKDPTLIKPYIQNWSVQSSSTINRGEESYTLLVLQHEAS